MCVLKERKKVRKKESVYVCKREQSLKKTKTKTKTK